MNTDKLFTIAYSKKITPLVIGDVLIKIGASRETIIKDCLEHWNDADGQDENWFVVSFAPRPNTGKQPVDGSVSIDATFGQGFANDMPADYFDWTIYYGDRNLKTWKLNHAALLAKYQSEQALQKLSEGDVIAVNSHDELPDAVIAKAKFKEQGVNTIEQGIPLKWLESKGVQFIKGDTYSSKFGGIYILSFTGRQNPGEQPFVPCLILNDDGKWTSGDREIGLDWSPDGSDKTPKITKWKPNHEILLKQYQQYKSKQGEKKMEYTEQNTGGASIALIHFNGDKAPIYEFFRLQ